MVSEWAIREVLLDWKVSAEARPEYIFHGHGH